MFRTQQNPMDDAIVRATDETLTSEDWSTILDVCDRVSASSSGPQQAVASMIKRLAHRNANVQLYTLELANALSQNCGAALHRELASKAFTDALLRLAADRNTHAQVKQKVLERMSTWTDEFARTPELGIMEQAYQKLRVQQPGLMPPGKPVKKEISLEDRKKEDEELQMALALSIKDKGTGGSQANGTASEGRDDSAQQPALSASAAAPSQGTTAATVSRVRALYDFTPSEAGELAFKKNDIIAVLESVYKDWWKGSLRGRTGIFPLNYVEKLQDPTKEELERDAQMEGEVFGEIKNVEKLLALLSVGGEGGGRRGEREEEEISELYQRTLSIRPKLIELIGRYSQKKDDFTQLNEKFIKARRDYEALLESSMSQTSYQQQYPIRARQPQYAQQPQYNQQPPRQAYPQHGPAPSVQGYPPQQSFPQSSQAHLPPVQPQQQDPQNFYTPSPSEPPGQQPGYGNAYPQQDGPPSMLPGTASAPFHVLPSGMHPQPPAQEIRRKPSPGGLSAHGPGGPYNPGVGFQGQIRPNSIHTLNSGNPQELATGGYESPIDNRHSYPSAQATAPSAPGPVAYDAYAPQQQQQLAPAPLKTRTDRDALPSRQRTQSFESPSSSYYSQQQPDNTVPPQQPQQQQQQQQQQAPQPQQQPHYPPYSQDIPPQHQQQQPYPPYNQDAPPPEPQQPPPMQPSAPPPGIPGSPDDGMRNATAHAPYQQPYQAYRPQEQRVPSGGEDPGDFYR